MTLWCYIRPIAEFLGVCAFGLLLVVSIIWLADRAESFFARRSWAWLGNVLMVLAFAVIACALVMAYIDRLHQLCPVKL